MLKYKRMKYKGVICEKCGVVQRKFVVNVWVTSNLLHQYLVLKIVTKPYRFIT